MRGSAQREGVDSALLTAGVFSEERRLGHSVVSLRAPVFAPPTVK